jgi:NADH-quinone oxidoreductase subunit C
MDEKKPPSKPAPKPKVPPVEETLRAPAPSRCLDRLVSEHADAIEGEASFHCGVPIVRVKPGKVVEVCRFLKDDPDTQMKLLSNLCGVDMVGLDRPDPRFDVVYNLFSLETKERITLRVAVAEDAETPTVSTVWRTAGWHEREAYDMYGIRFAGHPDLRRILMPYDFDAFPLRKDFPLEGREQDHGYWRKPEDDERN